MGQGELEEHPYQPHLHGDDAGVEQHLPDGLLGVGLGKQGDAGAPHEDAGGDDEQGAQKEALVAVGAADHGQAGKAGVADQGAVLEDALLLVWEAVVEHLAQKQCNAGHDGGDEDGHAPLLEGLQAELHVEGLKDHAGQGDEHHKVGQLIPGRVVENALLAAEEAHRHVDEEDGLHVHHLEKAVHTTPRWG